MAPHNNPTGRNRNQSRPGKTSDNATVSEAVAAIAVNSTMEPMDT
jgi:hypothetical protein